MFLFLGASGVKRVNDECAEQGEMAWGRNRDTLSVGGSALGCAGASDAVEEIDGRAISRRVSRTTNTQTRTKPYIAALQEKYGNVLSSRGAVVAHRDRDKGSHGRGYWRPWIYQV